jgi:hypothetical protein
MPKKLIKRTLPHSDALHSLRGRAWLFTVGFFSSSASHLFFSIGKLGEKGVRERSRAPEAGAVEKEPVGAVAVNFDLFFN